MQVREELLGLIQRTDPEIIEKIARVARSINIDAPDADAVEYLRQSVSSILGRNLLANNPEFYEVIAACREAAEFREHLFEVGQSLLPSKMGREPFCRRLSFDDDEVMPSSSSKKRKSIAPGA